MLELPKTEKNPKDTEGLCKCRPVCKSRRRTYNGKLQKTSAELVLERKPISTCKKFYPKQVQPNKPCPFFGKTKQVTHVPVHKATYLPAVVRICAAPIDDVVATPYLRIAKFAHECGATELVKFCCPFCLCGEQQCCPCGQREYPMRDPERAGYRRDDMRAFDNRVKNSYQISRIMYGPED